MFNTSTAWCEEVLKKDGGGEPRSKKVDNQADLLTNLPRTEVAVPNTTYKVFVIGRRVLNYCGGFGVEE